MRFKFHSVSVARCTSLLCFCHHNIIILRNTTSLIQRDDIIIQHTHSTVATHILSYCALNFVYEFCCYFDFRHTRRLCNTFEWVMLAKSYPCEWIFTLTHSPIHNYSIWNVCESHWRLKSFVMVFVFGKQAHIAFK